MVQGKCHQERSDQRPGEMRKPEMTKGQEETVERPGMQQWNRKPKHETAATRQNEIREPR
jgi:hypothetical protein